MTHPDAEFTAAFEEVAVPAIDSALRRYGRLPKLDTPEGRAQFVRAPRDVRRAALMLSGGSWALAVAEKQRTNGNPAGGAG